MRMPRCNIVVNMYDVEPHVAEIHDQTAGISDEDGLNKEP
jgi:hypothetical protein